MTPGRLKQIEDNLGAAFWIGGPTAVFARDALELVAALRDTEAEVDQLKQLAREAIDFAVVLSGAAADEYYWEYDAQLKELEARKP